MFKPTRLLVLLFLIAAGLALLRLLPTAQTNLGSIEVLQSTGQAPESAPARHPRSAWWNAVAAVRSEDYPQAIALMTPLAQAGDQEAQQLLAQVYEAQGNYALAISAWQQNRNAAALQRLGESARQAGQLEAARQAFQAAWEIDPIEFASLLSGFYLNEMNDAASAEAVLRQTLEGASMAPARPYLLRSLGRMLVAQERWAEAAQAFDEAISAAYLMIPGEGSLAELYAELAWTRHKAGQPEAALAAAGQALEMAERPQDRPLNWPYLLQFAQIFESAGQTQAALELYQRVLALKPGQQQALEAIERLSTP